MRNAVASLNAFVQEHITGMALVQAFAAEEREQEKFQQINKQHRNANIKAIFAYSVFFPIVELGFGIINWLTGLVGSKRIAVGYARKRPTNVAGIITAFILMPQFIVPAAAGYCR